MMTYQDLLKISKIYVSRNNGSFLKGDVKFEIRFDEAQLVIEGSVVTWEEFDKIKFRVMDIEAFVEVDSFGWVSVDKSKFKFDLMSLVTDAINSSEEIFHETN